MDTPALAVTNTATETATTTNPQTKTPEPTPQPEEPPDILTPLLTDLEPHHEHLGYQSGLADGKRQTRLRARGHGVAHAYATYLELGRLQARARVWDARARKGAAAERRRSPEVNPRHSPEKQPEQTLTHSSQPPNPSEKQVQQQQEQNPNTDPAQNRTHHPNHRLLTHTTALLHLVSPSSLHPSARAGFNDEEGVAALEEVLRRARGKCVVISRLLREAEAENENETESERVGTNGEEKQSSEHPRPVPLPHKHAKRLPLRRGVKVKPKGGTDDRSGRDPGDGSFEDFGIVG